MVGSSVAGIRAAETLRQGGFDGTVTVITEESGTPHDRPPLSKKFLSGDVDEERIALRKPEMLDALNLEWMRGTTATGLHAATRTITLDSGDSVTANGVIIATGGRARTLPNVPMVGGVHVLRTLHDAQSLRADLSPGVHMVVIGAGFIGLEAAATAAQMGAKVTVLEGAPAPLIRGLGEQMGAAVAAVHARNGVQVRCGVSVQGIEHDADASGARVTAVVLGDGERIECDVVLVGIGVTPATQWLEGSGLELRDGVVCDEFLSTGFLGVYAAGDLLRWPNVMFAHVETDMRVEHWTNAAEQGAAAATNLVAELNGTARTPYSAVPFFWSDQFDARIQFIGRSHPDAEVEVVAGSPEDGRFCAMYTLRGRLTGVLGVTMPKLVMPSRALLMRETSADEARAHFAALANPPAAPGTGTTKG